MGKDSSKGTYNYLAIYFGFDEEAHYFKSVSDDDCKDLAICQSMQ